MTNTPEKQLFITGTQRSGTTLLYKILNNSTTFHCFNEMHELHPFLFNEKAKGSLSQFLPTTNKDSPTPFLDYQSNAEKALALDASLRSIARDHGKSSWCLKDPRITYFLNEYFNAFSTSIFLIIIRDPRAVCRSYLDTSTFKIGRPTNWIAAAERWKFEIEQQLSFHKYAKDRTLIIRYESLVTEFENTVQKICDFINIEFTTEMLTYYQQGERVHAGNKNILDKPNPKIMHRWRETLPDKGVSTIESICGSLMKELNYEMLTDGKAIGEWKKKLARSSDYLRREWRWQMSKLRRPLGQSNAK